MGGGKYCITRPEDKAILKTILRGTTYWYPELLVSISIAYYCEFRSTSGWCPAAKFQKLFYVNVGFDDATSNVYLAGSYVMSMIIH
jgi:purine nucleoside permease